MSPPRDDPAVAELRDKVSFWNTITFTGVMIVLSSLLFFTMPVSALFGWSVLLLGVAVGGAAQLRAQYWLTRLLPAYVGFVSESYRNHADTHLAVIAKLREVDTTGRHRAICDREEQQWLTYREYGTVAPAVPGIVVPALSRASVELLRLDPDAYFTTVRYPFRTEYPPVHHHTDPEKELT